jgi:RNA polymerase sigma-70 factor (ECF subfamily)
MPDVTSRPESHSTTNQIMMPMESRDDRFEALYRAHYARVWRYLRSLRLSDDEAHDLSQDVFRRLYEHVESKPEGDEWPYLATVARNVAFNWFRSQKTQKRTAETESLDALPDGLDLLDRPFSGEETATRETNLIEEEEQRLRRRQLVAAVRKLSAGQQHCLRLRMQGFSYEEIALNLGVTLDAVKSRLRDAKKSLRASLDGPT